MSLISMQYGMENSFPFLDFHRIGLIVVVPIAAIVHALFRENVERIVGLASPVPSQPRGFFPVACSIVLRTCLDDFLLLLDRQSEPDFHCWSCRGR